MEQVTFWFLKNKKNYPWRENKTPYRVWVAEVMLQQTRAEVVLEYFQRWMGAFATVEKLANASQQEVIKLWEGLGYYSRARNLHAAAKEIVEKYGGQLPFEVDKLLKIKGIGPYTAGAISAFAFQKRCAFVDGNIARVVARYYGYEECVVKNIKSVTELVEKSLPQENADSFMEGLIELGQQVCKKKPNCIECPLKKTCIAYKEGRQDELPLRKVKNEVFKLERMVALILCNDTLLVRKNDQGKVMADLYEFPFIECKGERSVTHIKKAFSLPMELEMVLPSFQHTFTKYRVSLYPYLFFTKKLLEVKGHEWVALQNIDNLPFSSGHKRIKDYFIKEIISHSRG